jgi:outer membrane lipoprotein-sorting protein
MKSLVGLLFMTLLLHAGEAEELIRKLDTNLRGKDLYSKLQIDVKTPRHKRTMTIESWGRGKKNNFTKILSPQRDRGITFLNLDNQMWQYTPKIERIIKIPPSMMLQSWMGTDFTNDDVAKQSSLVDDYHVRIKARRGSVVTLELTPKPSAAVVWGKIISQVDTRHYTQIKDDFYDDDGVQVRTIRYGKVREFDGHFIATTMEVIPHDPEKQGNRTTITILEAVYDHGIDEGYFTKSALRRYSR